jgi:hypothetical protein
MFDKSVMVMGIGIVESDRSMTIKAGTIIGIGLVSELFGPDQPVTLGAMGTCIDVLDRPCGCQFALFVVDNSDMLGLRTVTISLSSGTEHGHSEILPNT